MPQRDYIGPAKKVTRTLVFDMKDLVKWLKTWLEEKRYFIYEKSHDEKKTADGISHYLHWECEKKVETYVKCIIEVRIYALTNDVIIERGKKRVTAQDGEVTVEFQGYLKKDTVGEWKLEAERPWRRVLKELYEKFILSDKFADYENTLKKDVNGLIDNAKSYLGVKRFD